MLEYLFLEQSPDKFTQFAAVVHDIVVYHCMWYEMTPGSPDRQIALVSQNDRTLETRTCVMWGQA